MNILTSLDQRSQRFWVTTGFILIVVVGVVDYLTGYEFALSVFYTIPISLIAWRAGRRMGVAASVISALILQLTDAAAGKSYSQPVVYVWNGLIELASFIIVVLLLTELKKTLDREKELAHSDYLTGAVNSRFFSDLLQMEINRSQRYIHPYTIAYFDIDDFKGVNDQFGHAAGDQVLRVVVNQAKSYLRKTDVVARLGGDEFALLLPETDEDAAKRVISKLQGDIFKSLQESQQWPVTFSIGVLTCIGAPDTPDEIIRLADDLMYSAKRGGKNAVKYGYCTG